MHPPVWHRRDEPSVRYLLAPYPPAHGDGVCSAQHRLATVTQASPKWSRRAPRGSQAVSRRLLEERAPLRPSCPVVPPSCPACDPRSRRWLVAHTTVATTQRVITAPSRPRPARQLQLLSLLVAQACLPRLRRRPLPLPPSSRIALTLPLDPRPSAAAAAVPPSLHVSRPTSKSCA
mgnify:CR=1 FL=1